MKKIDFHSHVIPHIDDGAKDTSTAIKMLEESRRQGVDGIIATPHFKGYEKDVEGFVLKRERMLEILQKRAEAQSADIPRIYSGAEVAVCSGLSEYTNLRSLCIENTDYILLEMPYSYWYDSTFDEVYKIIAKRGLIPIIAHIERYAEEKIDWEQYNKLLAMNVILQFNASSFCSFIIRKKIKQIIKNSSNLPIVLGSDCHDLGYRKTYFKKACDKIKKIYGKDFFNQIIMTADDILQNKKIDS